MADKRGTRLALSVGVAIGITILFVLGLGLVAASLMTEHPPLDTLVVAAGPQGFTVDRANSGSLDRDQLQASGLSPGMASLATGYRRVWHNDGSGQSLQVTAYDFGTASRVADYLAEFRDKAAQSGFQIDEIPGVSGSVRATGSLTAGNGELSSQVSAFGRGPLLFVVTAAGPDASVSNIAGPFSTEQVALVRSRYAGSTSEKADFAEAIGFIAGGIAGYLLLVELWAWFRDPLRRKTGTGQGTPPPTASGEVVSVDKRARVLRLHATGRFLVQATGLVLIASALFPGSAAARILLVVVGALLWGGMSLAHRSRGQARLRALGWNAAAGLGLVTGVAGLAFSAIQSGSDGGGQSEVGSALLLCAAGIAHRWGRRVSSRAAQDVLARDTRPMVLFLRSFGDDRRRLRTATLGRHSLIEKLAPGRFDSFEEVLVRHLSRLGPVVAVNPPGTGLAPLGAARATMPADAWQSQIESWLASARLVVIAAPPQEVTEGLMWELGHLGEWGKVTVVVPPTPDGETRRRWSQLSKCSGPGSPFQLPMPVDPALALLLRFEIDHWRVASATKRSEWTYAAALEAMVSA